ncbi:MAG: cupin domain-containing protein [Chthoniobacterales bacterium]
MKTSLAVVTVVGACALLAGRGYAQDPVKIAPTMNKVILNNDRVRVIDSVMKAGDQMPMHQHPDNVIYVVKGGKLRFVDMKGTPTDREMKDGECTFRPGETHAVQNTGSTEVHVITIELKK